MAQNNFFRLSITIVLVLVLLGIVLYPKLKPVFQSEKGSMPISGQQFSRGAGQPVYASGYVIVPTQMYELVKATGTLLPDEEVDLSFETSGKVVGIYFGEDSKVKKGDLLAKINDKPLQAQLLKLKAQLKLSQEKEFRQRQLLDRDAISRESYDQVSTELQALRADSMLLEAQIAMTELRAPFDGVVGLRMVSEGAYATTQTKIVRLVKTIPLKLEFSIPERYSGEVTPGFPVTFTVDGVTGTLDATVYAVDPKVDPELRTIIVRAIYPNKNGELKPGRFASIIARLSQIDNTISIPSESVIPEMEGEKVFIYKDGRAHQVPITIGLRTESNVQVTKGLQFGDTLLTTAILQLRENLPVQLDTLVTNQSLAK